MEKPLSLVDLIGYGICVFRLEDERPAGLDNIELQIVKWREGIKYRMVITILAG